MSLFGYFEKRLDPFPDVSLPKTDGSLISFIYACTTGFRGWLVAFTLLTALSGLYWALVYAWVGQIIDWMSVLSPGQLWADKRDELMVMLAISVCVPVVMVFETTVHHQVLQGVAPMRLRWIFHQHMLGQSMQFYQEEFSGRVSAKVMQTALSARDVVMTVIGVFVFIITFLVGSGAVLVNLHPLLAVPFVGWVLMVIGLLAFLLPKLQRSSKEQADARALMTGRITDAYANISTVKLFSHARRESVYAKEAMTSFLSKVNEQMRLVSVLEICVSSIALITVTGSVAIGLYLWMQGQVGAGAVAVAGALAIRLQGLTHWVLWETASLFEHLGTVQDGMKTLTTPHAVIDAPNAKAFHVKQGKIAFDAVTFNYGKSTNPPLLDQFTLNIQAGEKIGLVGRSGAGKSTLVNLLLRFYDVDGGTIRIDDQDISTITQETLRQNIGMVTQDTSLLHRTVRENIAYGKPDATDDEIIAAAKAAHAWEFIQTLKDKYGNTGLDTQVGERGVKLSGGQRQRIAIARVMLKNAPILLLDEATSALDSEVEFAITQSLDQMMAGKTVIAIAHRLSTIASMDRLVVMQAGRIVEMGTHDELIAKDGIYASLWARQSGGFLAEE
ncbi:ABC transporter ATP-binding protein/permease [Moraxella sp. FZLJ2107]|uniref:ABC transporter ATP-binding protein n=1 Tax=unclassified Moraxella TaxID=2685852 RepID=UPI00209BDCCD|nr:MULTISPECIES: ABC transporter ATP-binding protein [unclassified Moraxella]USZ15786.1 ABC transporter ATP-binding protein/permease [Moraxella sp. FZFQ2102]UTO04413.1 ABC transporter ATP-binding protein/permease [Moraxella sp. FZLJ2107]UTO23246.1 ABC transporter ATP-binding protein/permease [Moraxella sp. FZLJ2109]